jgi:hypothetical protein
MRDLPLPKTSERAILAHNNPGAWNVGSRKRVDGKAGGARNRAMNSRFSWDICEY